MEIWERGFCEGLVGGWGEVCVCWIDGLVLRYSDYSRGNYDLTRYFMPTLPTLLPSKPIHKNLLNSKYFMLTNLH